MAEYYNMGDMKYRLQITDNSFCIEAMGLDDFASFCRNAAHAAATLGFSGRANAGQCGTREAGDLTSAVPPSHMPASDGRKTNGHPVPPCALHGKALPLNSNGIASDVENNYGTLLPLQGAEEAGGENLQASAHDNDMEELYYDDDTDQQVNYGKPEQDDIRPEELPRPPESTPDATDSGEDTFKNEGHEWQQRLTAEELPRPPEICIGEAASHGQCDNDGSGSHANDPMPIHALQQKLARRETSVAEHKQKHVYGEMTVEELVNQRELLIDDIVAFQDKLPQQPTLMPGLKAAEQKLVDIMGAIEDAGDEPQQVSASS